MLPETDFFLKNKKKKLLGHSDLMEQEYFISISIPLVFEFANQIFFGSHYLSSKLILKLFLIMFVFLLPVSHFQFGN